MKSIDDLKSKKAIARRRKYYDTLHCDSCVCLDCGRTWRASEDDHFNISFCSPECNGEVDILVGSEKMEKYEER